MTTRFPKGNILPAWGIDPAAVLESQPLGENVWRLNISDGRVLILKRAWDRLSEARLISDAALMTHLHTHGVPVAVPLLTLDRQSFCSRDEQSYTLVPALPTGGEMVYGPALGRNVGEAIARLHLALVSYPHPIDAWTMNLPKRILDESLSRCREHLKHNSLQRFEAALSVFLPDAAIRLNLDHMQRLHGDCHGGNVLTNGNVVTGFVDMDHLPIGPRLYDVGYYLADRAKAGLNKARLRSDWLELVTGVLSGYANVTPWTDDEIESVWHVMVAAQILFVEVFSMHDNPDALANNLAALEWIVSQHANLMQLQATLTRI